MGGIGKKDFGGGGRGGGTGNRQPPPHPIPQWITRTMNTHDFANTFVLGRLYTFYPYCRLFYFLTGLMQIR